MRPTVKGKNLVGTSCRQNTAGVFSEAELSCASLHQRQTFPWHSHPGSCTTLYKLAEPEAMMSLSPSFSRSTTHGRARKTGCARQATALFPQSHLNHNKRVHGTTRGLSFKIDQGNAEEADTKLHFAAGSSRPTHLSPHTDNQGKWRAWSRRPKSQSHHHHLAGTGAHKSDADASQHEDDQINGQVCTLCSGAR